MIMYQVMSQNQADQLKEIDRSEYIDLIYETDQKVLTEIVQGHECPNWDEELLKEIQDRYLYELQHGGFAVGAFIENKLVGFGVLAHKFRGAHQDTLQVDLMYVSRNYRRQGIGSHIFNQLENEAKRRGAKYLYISSTETRSAVNFYRSQGSQITSEVDKELFEKEPKDIHMLRAL